MNKIIKDKYGSNRMHTESTCLLCGIKFWTRLDWYNVGEGRYCSFACARKSKTSKRITVKCDCCGKEKDITEVQFNKKTKTGYRFCSRLCRNKSQGIGKLIQPLHYGKSTIIRRYVNLSKDDKCLNCKNELGVKQRSYCCRKCQHDYIYKNSIEKWLSGEISGNHKGEERLAPFIRRYLMDRSNNKCSKCGWGEVNKKSGKIPLTINHIDGNAKNSIESNLEVLCPNCHSLTPNYGALNRGNGRLQRKLKIQNKNPR